MLSTRAACLVLALAAAVLAALTVGLIAVAGGAAWLWAAAAPALVCEVGGSGAALLGALIGRRRVQFGAASLLAVKASLALSVLALLAVVVVVANYGN